jgi:hypothetical protein
VSEIPIEQMECLHAPVLLGFILFSEAKRTLAMDLSILLSKFDGQIQVENHFSS